MIYHQSPLSPAQAKALARIYYEDLQGFSCHAVAESWRQYRQREDSRYMPKPGELMALARKVVDPNYREESDRIWRLAMEKNQ